MVRAFCVVAALTVLAACGDGSSKNNGSANNAVANNGVDATNGAPTDAGTSNDGGGNNGSNNGTSSATNNSTSNQTNGTNNTSLYTWHKDVRPIIEANCESCHFDGGIGPFPLTTYQEVSDLGALVKAATITGSMPPWPPADECGSFKHERTLTDAQRTAIATWVDNGKPEGDEADYVAPEIDSVMLGEPDYIADIGTEYTPNPPGGGIDDYHCFIIEHDFTEDQFVNAFQVQAGNISTVHHVLFWQIDKSVLPEARAKESSPGAGYTCFGGNGVGSELGLLGGWVPGTVPVKFEEGQGIRLPADSFIIVQIHYNTINGTSPDRTKVEMHFTDGPATTPLGMYPMPATDLFVAAGDANGEAGVEYRLPIGTTVYGMVPHMHMLGSRIRVQAGDQCLIDIPDWDFNWQGFYLYDTPVDVAAGATLKLECWYDNSAANQPNGRTPQDVRWGEGTYDEMCLNYFIIEELPF